MIITININANVYRKFKTALTWFGEDEEAVIERIMADYADPFFKNLKYSGANTSAGFASEKEGSDNKQIIKRTNSKEETKVIKQAIESSVVEQRQSFVRWLMSQKSKTGQAYSHYTAKAYAQVLANVLRRNSFVDIPVENLFEISDSSEFESLEKEIRNSPEFGNLSRNTRDLFGPAMSKYAEFLRGKEQD